MNHKNTIYAVLLLSALGALSAVTTADDDLAANFAAPPASGERLRPDGQRCGAV